MSNEFMSPEQALGMVRANVMACRACPLCETVTNKVFGSGTTAADVMLIGEAPGANEDKTGEPFVGAAGKKLNDMLARAGIERSRVYVANVLKCRPPKNRDPNDAEIAICSQHLMNQIRFVAPRVILTLGAFATRRILNTQQGIGAMRGRAWVIETLPNVVVIPTYHPAACIYDPSKQQVIEHDLAYARQVMTGMGIA